MSSINLCSTPTFGWESDRCNADGENLKRLHELEPKISEIEKLKSRAHFFNRNKDKLLGYIPLCSIFVGFQRLIDTDRDQYPVGNGRLQIIRSIAEIFQLGVLLIVIDVIATLWLKCHAQAGGDSVSAVQTKITAVNSVAENSVPYIAYGVLH